MAPRVALTSPEQTALAGPHAARLYCAAVANTIVATATVVSVSSDGLTITVTSTSAGWGNVNAGMTFEVANGSTLRFNGRVRWKGADATHLYPMELSLADPGAIAQTIRTAGITAGDTLAVYKRRDFWSVAPKINPETGEIFEDGDATVTSDNTRPGPVINVKMVDSRGNTSYGDFGCFVDDGQTFATIVFTVAPVLWPTSSSVNSYAWTAPASWGSPTAGSISGATVTYRVPVGGQTNYEILCAVFDDILQARVGYRNVWVFDHGSNAPISIAEFNAEVNEQGARASITLNDNGLASIPAKGNKVLVFHDATFNGSVITSAWHGVTGWVTRVNEQTEPGLRGAALDIEGPAGMLSKLGAYSQYVTAVSSTPQNAQEIWASLASMDYQVFWLASLRAQNTVATQNWSALGLVYTSQDLPVWKIDATGNLFSQMQTIAATRQCSFGFNADGEAMVKKIPSLVAYASRGTDVVTRGTLTPSIYSKITFNKEPRPKVRRERAEAFTYGGGTLPTPLLADAPGAAPGQGTGDDRLQSQIVDSQSELNQIGGDDWAMKNNPYSDIEIEIPGLWGLMMNPAEQNFWAVTVRAADSPDGVAKSLNVILRSVSLRSEGSGAFTTTVRCYAETAGVAATTVNVPTQATTPTQYTTPPPVSTPDTGSISFNGQTVIAWNPDDIAWTNNLSHWRSLTQTGMLGSQPFELRLDPRSDMLISHIQTANLGAWVAAQDTTDGGLYYIASLFSGTWAQKRSYPGLLYAHVRPSIAVSGGLYVAWNDGSADTVLEYLTNYGATLQWSQTIPGTNAFGMDIDCYGADEVLISGRSFGRNRLYRVLNGGSPTEIAVGLLPVTGRVTFVQKPILKFAGGSNNSTGASENFILNTSNGNLYKSTNGGTSITDVAPTGTLSLNMLTNSIMAVDNPNVMAVVDENTNILYTSTDGGSSWTNQGAGGYTAQWGLGWFPRQINGQYVLYAGDTGGNPLFYPNFGSTVQSIVGDWADEIGTLRGIIGVIPLY